MIGNDYIQVIGVAKGLYSGGCVQNISGKNNFLLECSYFPGGNLPKMESGLKIRGYAETSLVHIRFFPEVSFHIKKAANAMVVAYAFFKFPGDHDFIPNILIYFCRAIDYGVGEIVIVSSQQLKIFDMAQILRYGRRGLHIREHEYSFFLLGGVVFAGKKVDQDPMTNIVANFGIDQGDTKGHQHL